MRRACARRACASVIILIIILNTKQSETSIVCEYFVLKFTEESI